MTTQTVGQDGRTEQAGGAEVYRRLSEGESRDVTAEIDGAFGSVHRMVELQRAAKRRLRRCIFCGDGRCRAQLVVLSHDDAARIGIHHGHQVGVFYCACSRCRNDPEATDPELRRLLRAGVEGEQIVFVKLLASTLSDKWFEFVAIETECSTNVDR